MQNCQLGYQKQWKRGLPLQTLTMVLKLGPNSKSQSAPWTEPADTPTHPRPSPSWGWVLVGELVRVSRYRSRWVGDIQRRSQNFSRGQEAEHVDDGQLDHSCLEKALSLYVWAGREEAKVELSWTWLGLNVVFSAYAVSVTL